jgi:hypothetical protein
MSKEALDDLEAVRSVVDALGKFQAEVLSGQAA